MVLSKIQDKAREFKAHVPEMRRVMRESRRFMHSVDPFSYRLAWVSSVYNGVAGLGIYAMLGVFFQTFGAPQFQEWFKSGNISWSIITTCGVALMLYFAGRNLFWIASNFREREWKERVNIKIEQQTIDHLAGLDAGRLADPEFIKLKDQATRRYRFAAPELFETQRKLLGATVGLIASTGVIMILDPLFIVLAAMPVAITVFRNIKLDNRRRVMWDENHLIERRKSEYELCLTQLPRLLQGKLFRYDVYWRERFMEYQKTLWSRAHTLRLWTLKWDVAISAVEAAAFGVLVAYLGGKLVSGEAEFSQLFFFWGSMRTLAGSLGEFSNASVDVRTECIDYGYRERFMATKPLLDESNAEPFRFVTTPRLELKNVSFRYPRQENLVLSGCSLAIAPGEKVAFVGENGSGKTTVLRLLSKIYVPDEGVVVLDGLSTSRITQACWFEQMLYATQDSGMPGLIVEEAIAGVRPGSADMSRLHVAAEHSRAASVIGELPEGYQTQLGVDWPGGWEPSAGQFQRLKITAAVYRLLEPQVRVGLFDEPMSQCDVETRDFFYKGLRSLHGKTVIVVAHDPVYLHYFDRVILIEHGRVVRDMRTPEDIAVYQREAIPQFEDAERKGNLRVVE